jgi:aminoglycoside phosphotransferase (APT) family kinase protein
VKALDWHNTEAVLGMRVDARGADDMSEMTADCRRPLPRKLADVIRSWGLADPVLIGEGYDFDVYRAGAADGALVVLRVARRRYSHNAHDPWVDSRDLLEQEFALASYLLSVGCPVARPRRLEFDVAGTDVLVSDYVPDDGASLDSYHLGQQLVRLHALKPLNVRLSAQESLPFEVLAPTRLARWWRELQLLVPGMPDMLPDAVLRDAVAQRRDIRRLLHLDVRRANLRCVGGRVQAFIDWSNAIIGDPAFELARIQEIARLPENGLDPDQVRAGYGQPPWLGGSDLLHLIYRLDAAVMLALLFTAEEPCSKRGPHAVEHALRLRAAAAAAAARA